MKTYIANCTQQNQIINFRLPEGRKVMTHTIPMGRQLLIGDLSPPEIEALQAQLGPYGLVPVADIGRSRNKITYVYSTSGPVSAANIGRALDRNRAILREEGKKRRENAAIAANMGMNTDETPVKNLEMTIEEVTSGTLADDEPVGEGFRIDNTQSMSENRRPRRRTVKADA
jgi:hypothetical protein